MHGEQIRMASSLVALFGCAVSIEQVDDKGKLQKISFPHQQLQLRSPAVVHLQTSQRRNENSSLDSEPWFASALATDRGTQKEESACSYNNSLGSPGSRTHFVIGRGRYLSKRCVVTAVHTCQGLLTRLFCKLRHPEIALIGLSVARRLRRWAPRPWNPASPFPPPERPSAPL